MKRTSNTSLIALSLTAMACSPAASPESESHNASEASEATGPSDHIDVTATIRQNLGITFAQVELRRVAQTVRVPGAFELQPLARHEYRMVLPGRVELAVDQYQEVEPDDLLFRYQSTAWPELLHEVVLGEQAMDIASAEIEVWQAKIDEARGRLALFDERLASLARADFKKAELEVQAEELRASLPRLQADLRLAETRRVNAERTREHALHRAAIAAGISEAELEAEVEVDGRSVPNYQTLDWIEVRATSAGVVETLAVTNGAFVESPDLVLSTIDPLRVRFRAIALQADLPQLVGAHEGRIVPPPSPGVPLDGGVEASITIGLEAHPEERTISLLATPKDHPTWIRPGVSAFLETVVDFTAEPTLAIPRQAIVQDGLEHVFFRRNPQDPNELLRVVADLGTSDGRWVVVQSGVMRGDEVVLTGAYELKLATQRGGQAQSGGHVHADGTTHDDH